jgi:cytosine/creatinine deaminase
MLPSKSNYLLKNSCVPVSLLEERSLALKSVATPVQAREGLCAADLEIAGGKIARIIPAGSEDSPQLRSIPAVDLRGGLVWPSFIDMHAHLDKGHIWNRSPNPDGTFAMAIDTVRSDTEKYWNAEDVYREQGMISLKVFKALQAAWGDRLILQAVSLV